MQTTITYRNHATQARCYPELECCACLGTGQSRAHPGTVCGCVRPLTRNDVLISGARTDGRRREGVAA